MIKRDKKGLVALVVGCMALCFGASAYAQDSVTELHAVDSPRGKMIVAVSGNGVTFVDGKEGKSFRAFKSSRKSIKGGEPDWFQIRDVDKDGTPDIIGAGKPAYIISGNGDPIHKIAKGCDQFHLGDFAADKAPDIACRQRTSISVSTYDGQNLWKYTLQGLRLGVCNFGDFDGDLRDDIECAIKGKGTFVRISGEGEEKGRTFDSASLDRPEDDNPGLATNMANYLKGEELFDLNGDGTAEEWVKLDGNALVVGTKSNPKALARHETGPLFSILVDDIDGDNKMEIVAGGKGKVFLMDETGKLTHTITSDPKKLKRSTDVRIDGFNVNALADESDATIQAALDKVLPKLTACYSGNVKRNAFAKVGRTIWALNVSKDGKVSGIERLHSDLNDKKVEGCISKALKKAKLPKGTAPDSSATVTFEFGFVDR